MLELGVHVQLEVIYTFMVIWVEIEELGTEIYGIIF